jgi:hypothetical protein
MGDNILNLPTDNTIPTANELVIFQQLFDTHSKTTKTVALGLSDVLVASALFFLVSLPITGSLVQKVYPVNNCYAIIVLKTVFFAMLLFFLRNIELSQKNDSALLSYQKAVS